MLLTKAVTCATMMTKITLRARGQARIARAGGMGPGGRGDGGAGRPARLADRSAQTVGRLTKRPAPLKEELHASQGRFLKSQLVLS